MDDLSEFATQAEQCCAVLLREGIHDWLLSQPGLVQRWGTWVEFGVAGGGTFSTWAKQRGRARLWGFDSFRGLPEDWKDDHLKGKFAADHPPMPPEGCHYVVGLFADTLPSWSPPDPITFAHIDCDLYRGARQALAHIRPRLADGAVIVLDDCFTPPIDNGVMRAMHEVMGSWPRWEWIGRSNSGDAAAIRVRT